MKTLYKSILVVVIVITCSTISHGQIKFIPKVGASWTAVSFDKGSSGSPPTIDYGSKVGVVAGVAMEIPIIGKTFSIQPELLFHQKGYTSNYIVDETTGDYTTALNYLEIPIMARLNFGRFYATAGSYFAVGIGGKYSGYNTYLSHTEHHTGDIKFGQRPSNYNGSADYVRPFDAGLAIGAGVKLSSIVVEVRYGLGLASIYDESNLNSPALNRSLQLTVGVPLEIKRK